MNELDYKFFCTADVNRKVIRYSNACAHFLRKSEFSIAETINVASKRKGGVVFAQG
jgi:hypothetical protein